MISIKTRNIESISKKISEVPWGARGAATEAAALVIMGNEQTGLKHYPAKPAGSVYTRTYALRFGWQAQKWGDGTGMRIVNGVEYAPYVQSPENQTWFHKLHGWKTTTDIITSNAALINLRIDQAVNRFLKSKGLI